MKKLIVLLVALSAFLLAACQPSITQNTDDTGNSPLSTDQTTVPTDTVTTTPDETTQAVGTDPAEDQLAVFNALFCDMSSWYNKALLCQYTSLAQLNLKTFFYSGFVGESTKPTDAEWAELNNQPGFDINYDLIRLPVDKMNQVLTDYFGITLDDIDDRAFENLVFLESTNCYYHMATDAMAVENFKATTVGPQEDGTIRVTYTAGFDNESFVVTLVPNGEGYRILSNEQA